MSLSICANCLSRLKISSRSTPSLFRASTLGNSFSTTSVQYANPPKKQSNAKGAPVAKHREARSVKIKKKSRERPKPPAVGERKAARKRIVLSNTNALEVSGMPDLSVENMSDSGNIGQFLGLEGTVLDQLREVKAFKPTQNWNMFRKPATLIRDETVALGNNFKIVNDSTTDQVSGSKTIRQVITGEKSSGKSLLLVQAMTMAFLNKWVVINVPEAHDFTINQSSYALAQTVKGEGQHEQHYIHPHLTSALLSRIAHANSDVLSNLKVSQDHSSLNVAITKKMSLKDLAMAGVDDTLHAWSIWQALWKELTQPTTAQSGPRPPVLVAIDGLDHWMAPTQYRSAEYNIIHAHQFLLIRQFVSLLFLQSALPNGGMVLAATTGSNTLNLPSFSLLLRQLNARASGLQIGDPAFPMPEPYSKVDQHVLDLLQGSEGTELQTLKGLSRVEARGLLEYFAKSGIFKETITDAVVGEKWSLSGGGVIGEMARFGKRVRVHV